MEKYHYYVNDRPEDTGEHEVHREDCFLIPIIKSKTPLGEFYTCHAAVAKAKTIYNNVDGCRHCSEECHTR